MRNTSMVKCKDNLRHHLPCSNKATFVGGILIPRQGAHDPEVSDVGKRIGVRQPDPFSISMNFSYNFLKYFCHFILLFIIANN